MLLFVGKEKIYFVFVVLKYSRRKYRNPPKKKHWLSLRLNLKKKSCCMKRKGSPKTNRKLQKDTGANFKGFPLANLRQFEYEKEYWPWYGSVD